MTLLHSNAHASKRAGIDNAARPDDSGLSGGDAAVRVIEKVSVTDLGFGMKVCLIVASAEFSHCTRQERYGRSMQIGIAFDGS